MHADDKQLEEATIPNWCQNVVKFTHDDTTQIARVATAFAAAELALPSSAEPTPATLNLLALRAAFCGYENLNFHDL
jgi:hypothetical protein